MQMFLAIENCRQIKHSNYGKIFKNSGTGTIKIIVYKNIPVPKISSQW
jgi:hypothetical protein